MVGVGSGVAALRSAPSTGVTETSSKPGVAKVSGNTAAGVTPSGTVTVAVKVASSPMARDEPGVCAWSVLVRTLVATTPRVVRIASSELAWSLTAPPEPFRSPVASPLAPAVTDPVGLARCRFPAARSIGRWRCS